MPTTFLVAILEVALDLSNLVMWILFLWDRIDSVRVFSRGEDISIVERKLVTKGNEQLFSDFLA